MWLALISLLTRMHTHHTTPTTSPVAFSLFSTHFTSLQSSWLLSHDCRSQNQRPELHTKLHVWAVLKTPWLLDSLVQSENRAFCNCAHELLILILSTKIPSKFSHMILKRHLWSWPFGTKTITSSFYLRFTPCNFFSFIIHYYHPFSLFLSPILWAVLWVL